MPYRIRSGRVELALITARSNGKRWVLPKGSPRTGEAPGETALRETREEAGLRGELVGKPLGHYHYSKECGRVRVEVYLMRVTSVEKSWPEDHFRRRRWIAAESAPQRLDSDDLRLLVQRAVRKLSRS